MGKNSHSIQCGSALNSIRLVMLPWTRISVKAWWNSAMGTTGLGVYAGKGARGGKQHQPLFLCGNPHWYHFKLRKKGGHFIWRHTGKYLQRTNGGARRPNRTVQQGRPLSPTEYQTNNYPCQKALLKNQHSEVMAARGGGRPQLLIRLLHLVWLYQDSSCTP